MVVGVGATAAGGTNGGMVAIDGAIGEEVGGGVGVESGPEVAGKVGAGGDVGSCTGAMTR
jgi:hypothetical protein